MYFQAAYFFILKVESKKVVTKFTIYILEGYNVSSDIWDKGKWCSNQINVTYHIFFQCDLIVTYKKYLDKLHFFSYFFNIFKVENICEYISKETQHNIVFRQSATYRIL